MRTRKKRRMLWWLKMASDKNKCVDSKKDSNWRQSSIRKEAAIAGLVSSDDNLTARTSQPKCGTPKFLRTQSSSGILPSPRKSRSACRFFGNLMHTSNSGDSFNSKSSIQDNNCNFSSLNNLTRLMSPSHRNPTSSLNQSKSLRSVDHIIDENTEFRSSCNNLIEPHIVYSTSMTTSLELHSALEASRSSIRLTRYRIQHFRRRSISWDSSNNAKPLKRYGYLIPY